MKNEEIDSIEIPLDKVRSKYINEKAINFLEEFLENKYKVVITKSIEDDLEILRITKI